MSFEVVSLSISVLTLGILALTGVFLYRQTRVSQLQAARDHQLALFQMAFDDPDLRSTWSGESMEDDAWRVAAFRNLWFMHQQMVFVTGTVPEEGLRARLRAEYLVRPEALEWWAVARDAYLADAVASRQHRRFVCIVDEEVSLAAAQAGSVDE